MSNYSATITASSDDAREVSGTVTLNTATITFQTNTTYGGLRFTNLTIPQGSTINTATLTVTVSSGTFDDPNLTIRANDIDDATTFTTTGSDISGRTTTTAATTWAASSIGVGAKTSPSIVTIIQEIIDRPGWASGNNLALILKSNNSDPFRYNAYDNGSADYATLDIDYTATSGGSGQPPRTIHQFRQRTP